MGTLEFSMCFHQRDIMMAISHLSLYKGLILFIRSRHMQMICNHRLRLHNFEGQWQATERVYFSTFLWLQFFSTKFSHFGRGKMSCQIINSVLVFQISFDGHLVCVAFWFPMLASSWAPPKTVAQHTNKVFIFTQMLDKQRRDFLVRLYYPVHIINDIN